MSGHTPHSEALDAAVHLSHKAVEAASRYPGARSFRDDPWDRLIFFGRAREARELAHVVLASRLAVVFGKSGSGKTSLLNAGVLHRLRARKFVPIVVRLNDATRRPAELVYGAVEDLDGRDGFDVTAGNRRSLWHYFKTVQVWHEDELLTPVLVFDQFEELFTLNEVSRRQVFVRALADLVRGTRPASAPTDEDGDGDEGLRHLNDRAPAVKTILSLREDFLADLEELARDIPEVFDRRFRMDPLGREAARQAIVEPSRVVDAAGGSAPFVWDDDCVDRLTEHLLGGGFEGAPSAVRASVEPFQLQLVCRHVEERAQEEGATASAPFVATYEKLGGAEGVARLLGRFYERTLRSVARGRPRRALRRLLEEGFVNPQGRRLSLEQSDIAARFHVDRRLLDQLVDHRLLRKEPRLGSCYFELSHDTLTLPIREARTRRTATWRRTLVSSALAVALLATVFLAMSGQRWANAKNTFTIQKTLARAESAVSAGSKERAARQAAQQAARAEAEQFRLRTEDQTLESIVDADGLRPISADAQADVLTIVAGRLNGKRDLDTAPTALLRALASASDFGEYAGPAPAREADTTDESLDGATLDLLDADRVVASPFDRLLAVLGDGTLSVTDFRGIQRGPAWPIEADELGPLAFVPDDGRIALVVGAYQPDDTEQDGAESSDPESEQARTGWKLRIFRPGDTGSQDCPLAGRPDVIALDPQGNRLAGGFQDGKLCVLTLEGDGPCPSVCMQAHAGGTDGAFRSIRYSPDGDVIVSVGEDGLVQYVETSSFVAGSEPFGKLLFPDGTAAKLSMSTDGADWVLVDASGGARIGSDDRPRRLKDAPTGIVALPSGELAAAGRGWLQELSRADEELGTAVVELPDACGSPQALLGIGGLGDLLTIGTAKDNAQFVICRVDARLRRGGPVAQEPLEFALPRRIQRDEGGGRTLTGPGSHVHILNAWELEISPPRVRVAFTVGEQARLCVADFDLPTRSSPKSNPSRTFVCSGAEGVSACAPTAEGKGIIALGNEGLAWEWTPGEADPLKQLGRVSPTPGTVRALAELEPDGITRRLRVATTEGVVAIVNLNESAAPPKLVQKLLALENLDGVFIDSRFVLFSTRGLESSWSFSRDENGALTTRQYLRSTDGTESIHSVSGGDREAPAALLHADGSLTAWPPTRLAGLGIRGVVDAPGEWDGFSIAGDGRILFDYGNRRLLGDWNAPGPPSRNVVGTVFEAGPLGDGLIATRHATESVLYVADATTRRRQWWQRSPRGPGKRREPYALATDPASGLLAVGTRDATIYVYDRFLRLLGEIRPLPETGGPVEGLAFARPGVDGEERAAAAPWLLFGRSDGTVGVTTLEGENVVLRTGGADSGGGRDGAHRVDRLEWNAAEKRVVAIDRSGDVFCVEQLAWSSGSSEPATQSCGAGREFSLDLRNDPRRGDYMPVVTALSTGGEWLAWGTSGGRVGVRDVRRAATGKKRETFARELSVGAGRAVSSVGFAANGALVCAADRGGEIRLWSLDDGRLVRRFEANGRGVHVAVPIEGGRALLSLIGRDVVARWPASPEEWVATSCRRVGGYAERRRRAHESSAGGGVSVLPLCENAAGFDGAVGIGKRLRYWAWAGDARGLVESLGQPDARATDRRELLRLAIRSGSLSTVEAVLDAPEPVELDEPLADGDPPLLATIRPGGLGMARALLQRGANPLAKGQLGDTALHRAAMRPDPTFARLLLRPSLYAGSVAPEEILTQRNAEGLTPLLIAAWYGNEATARVLLEQPGAESTTRSTGPAGAPLPSAPWLAEQSGDARMRDLFFAVDVPDDGPENHPSLQSSRDLALTDSHCAAGQRALYGLRGAAIDATAALAEFEACSRTEGAEARWGALYVGWMYEHGTGCEANLASAAWAYWRAVALGSREALERLHTVRDQLVLANR